MEADTLVRWWLGSELADGVFVVRVVLLSVPAGLAYSLLSPVSDASAAKPVTTCAASAALAVCVAGSVIFHTSSSGMAVAFTAGQIIAAVILMVSVVRRFGISLHLPVLVMWAFLSAAGSLLIEWSSNLIALTPLFEFLVAVGLGATMLVVALRMSPPRLGLWRSILSMKGGLHAQ
jgi:O-antigen/teichoic acid export membrane protein